MISWLWELDIHAVIIIVLAIHVVTLALVVNEVQRTQRMINNATTGFRAGLQAIEDTIKRMQRL